MCLKGIWCCNFHGKSNFAEKGFWVVNTSWAPVPKRLEKLALNFTHTFLRRCWVKICPVFSTKSHSFFISIIRRVLKEYFAWKQFIQKYLKRGKSRARLCLPLDWLHISVNKLMKTAILLVQELRKYKK